MIADLSSFLEVACAMYASICIDDRLSLELWKLDFSPDVQSVLNSDEEWKKNKLEKVTNECVDEKFQSLRLGFRRLGAAMLIECVLLLCYIALEKKEYVPLHGGRMALILIISLVFMIIFSLVYSRWKMNKVRQAILCLFIICCPAFLCGDKLMNFYSVGCTDERVVNLIAIAVITIPFLYMLFWRKLLICRERLYIDAFLKKELGYIIKVNKANQGEIKLAKKEVPDEYYAITGEYNITNMGEDVDFQSLLEERFKERFYKWCDVPGIVVLMIGYIWASAKDWWNRPVSKKS